MLEDLSAKSKMPETQQEQQTEAESEELDFNKPSYTFIPKGIHDWRQMGYYLVCKGCDIEHAVWVGKDKLMVGQSKKGQPILKTRKSLGMA